MNDFTYKIESVSQLDDFQHFYNERGLCQVLEILEPIDSYKCEVIETEEVFYLEIGDRISLN